MEVVIPCNVSPTVLDLFTYVLVWKCIEMRLLRALVVSNVHFYGTISCETTVGKYLFYFS